MRHSEFDSKEFAARYDYSGNLGVCLGQETTMFRVWAPTAERVCLNLYQAGNDCEAYQVTDLVPGEKGTWSVEFPERLAGIYYDYDVTVDRETRRTGDPYAVACGVNGERSMVIDLRKTDPEGWDQDKAPVKGAENIIYEMHIKEFSWDKRSGAPEHLRGKYKALTLKGTTLQLTDDERENGSEEWPTMMNYLEQLGVTHVQLQPIYDYGSVDEAGSDEEFNWGYDPVNYNIPEGSYSTDPYHGEVRIQELKEAIAALHASGFRVIMDVVYNHTYHLDSCLNRMVPWYYYRQMEDGRPSDGSGCSNDLASERSMVSRYIIDSVLYWAREYHLDGFRFDLMGLLDVPMMEQIQKSLDDIYGKNEKLIYGEPWRCKDTFPAEGTFLADKAAFAEMNPAIGAFCDATRDAIKGNLMHKDSAGFVNGGKLSAQTLKNCLGAWVGAMDEFSTVAPTQTLSYISSHDDWTLWDRLVFSLDPKKDFLHCPEFLRKMNRLAAAICYSCQGNLFLLAGEEFCRTKEGIRDSFCSPIAINRLDWRKSWQNRDMVNYYRGLFTLRKQLAGLCDKSDKAIERIRKVNKVADNCVVALIDNRNGGQEKWTDLVFVANTSDKRVDISIPAGNWQKLLDGDSSFLWMDDLFVTGKASVEAGTALVLGKCEA